MAKMAIYGHMAIGLYAKKMGKWGIPEKNYWNVAQQSQLDGCSAFLADVIANKLFVACVPVCVLLIFRMM